MPRNFPLSQGEDDFHSNRSSKTPVQELLQVGDDFIPEAEIVELWHGGKHGAELHITGDRSLPVPKDEVNKVQDFLEARNESIGLHRRLLIGGERVVQSDIFEVVEKEGIPHVILDSGRVIKAKPLEISGLKATVERNQKVRKNAAKPPASVVLPAFCEDCKRFFASPSISVGFGAGVQIKGNKVICPTCGKFGVIPDGKYLNVGGALKFINESNLTPHEVQTLKWLLGEAIANSTPVTQLIISIQNEVPKAAGLTEFFTGGLTFPTILTMLLGLLAWLYPPAPPVEPETRPRVTAPSPSKRSVRRDRHKGIPKTRASKPQHRKK